MSRLILVALIVTNTINALLLLYLYAGYVGLVRYDDYDDPEGSCVVVLTHLNLTLPWPCDLTTRED